MARISSNIWKRLWDSMGVFAAMLLTIHWLNDWQKLMFVWLGYFAINSFFEYHEGFDEIDERERFEKLKMLQEKGFITPEEYEAKRQEILKDL
jgi:hypothetical protein